MGRYRSPLIMSRGQIPSSSRWRVWLAKWNASAPWPRPRHHLRQRCQRDCTRIRQCSYRLCTSRVHTRHADTALDVIADDDRIVRYSAARRATRRSHGEVLEHDVVAYGLRVSAACQRCHGAPVFSGGVAKEAVEGDVGDVDL